jgi:hypothetical protein
MNKKSLKLYCFSPPVMLATLAVELGFAIFVFLRYKSTIVSRLAIAILVSLALFQGTEYLLCGMQGISGGMWSRIGYSAITLLPPLGIHLALSISKQTKPWLLLIRIAYATAIFFILYFAFYTPAITGQTCYANYVVFEGKGSPLASWLYSAYYYGWLLVGTGLSIYYGYLSKRANICRALFALALGYASFIIPTTTANLVDPATIHAIPSIMCGFAVLLAFVLVGKVLPEAHA